MNNPENPDLLREHNRGDASNMVMCSKCHVFAKKAYFSDHRQKCPARDDTDDRRSEPIPVKRLSTNEVTPEFTALILSKFQKESIQRLCQNDTILQIYGIGKKTSWTKFLQYERA